MTAVGPGGSCVKRAASSAGAPSRTIRTRAALSALLRGAEAAIKNEVGAPGSFRKRMRWGASEEKGVTNVKN